MQMSMEMGPETIGMLLVDGIMYIQSSQAGGKYIKYDLSDPSNPLGSGLADQLDPAGSIETFTKALSSVTSSGAEDVDGRTLDRYVLTVDTTQLGGQTDTTGAAGGDADHRVARRRGPDGQDLHGHGRRPVRRLAVRLRQGRRPRGAAEGPGRHSRLLGHGLTGELPIPGASGWAHRDRRDQSGRAAKVVP